MHASPSLASVLSHPLERRDVAPTDAMALRPGAIGHAAICGRRVAASFDRAALRGAPEIAGVPMSAMAFERAPARTAPAAVVGAPRGPVQGAAWMN